MTPQREVHVSHAADRRSFGAFDFVRVYLVLLFAVPANLTIAGTGAVGSPATVIGILAFGWWVAATLAGLREFVGRNVVRTALFLYLASVAVSWSIGRMRSLTVTEASSSDRAVLVLAGFVGIALVTMDGIRNREEVERLVGWVTGSAMVMVFVGTVQFFAGWDITSTIQIPGLELNTDLGGVSSRAIFNRPNGTALHAIEFGVVSAALLPFAYWLIRVHRSTFSYVAAAALSFAAMVSLSRSAVLAGAIVGIVIVVTATSWKQRLTIVGSAGLFVVVVGSVVGGLVGTLRNLFTQADSDTSVQARIDRFPQVLQLISEYRYFGRGYGTYTIDDYLLLDNQMFITAIESGLVGVSLLIVFIAFVASVAWRSGVGDESARLLSVVLIATILALFISSYTFDAFYYRILTGILYLSIGLVGALYRLTAAERAEHERRMYSAGASVRASRVESLTRE